MSVEHFRRRADECRRLATDAHNASDKAFWLGLVARWEVLESQKLQQTAQVKSRSPLSLTESHSLLAMAAVILPRCGSGIGWRRAAAGDVR